LNNICSLKKRTHITFMTQATHK